VGMYVRTYLRSLHGCVYKFVCLRLYVYVYTHGVYMCVCIYSRIYIQHLYVCVYMCVYIHRFYKCVCIDLRIWMCVCVYLRISYRVYMCVCVHLRVCTQTSHVSLYILPYKYAESTYVTSTHTESTCVCT